MAHPCGFLFSLGATKVEITQMIQIKNLRTNKLLKPYRGLFVTSTHKVRAEELPNVLTISLFD